MGRPEHQGKGDAHCQSKTGEDKPASLPVAHEESRIAHLLPCAEVVDDGSCWQRADGTAQSVGHQHEQTLRCSLDFLRTLTINKDATGDIEEIESYSIHDAGSDEQQYTGHARIAQTEETKAQEPCEHSDKHDAFDAITLEEERNEQDAECLTHLRNGG